MKRRRALQTLGHRGRGAAAAARPARARAGAHRRSDLRAPRRRGHGAAVGDRPQRARTRPSTTSCAGSATTRKACRCRTAMASRGWSSPGRRRRRGYVDSRSRRCSRRRRRAAGASARCRSRCAASLLDAAFKAADVRNLPGRPDGKHVVADLMAHYFRSSAANDLCYNARIGRNTYRAIRVTTVRPRRSRSDA